MLVSCPWVEGWDDLLTNPENCMTAPHCANNRSRQQAALRGSIKPRQKRPESVSDIQRRLEYLERKMQSINLEDSSCSDDSELESASKKIQTAFFLSDKKSPMNKLNPRASNRRSSKVKNKDHKELFTTRKSRPFRHESTSAHDQQVKLMINAKLQKALRVRPRLSKHTTQQSKSLNHRNMHSHEGVLGSRHEVERAINHSDRSLSVNSLRKRAKKIKLEHQRKRLKRIERELLRFQKENKLLRGKLRLFQELRTTEKKPKVGLMQSQKNDSAKRPLKDTLSKGIDKSATKKIPTHLHRYS